jgi:hypothetical protein
MGAHMRSEEPGEGGGRHWPLPTLVPHASPFGILGDLVRNTSRTKPTGEAGRKPSRGARPPKGSTGSTARGELHRPILGWWAHGCLETYGEPSPKGTKLASP